MIPIKLIEFDNTLYTVHADVEADDTPCLSCVFKLDRAKVCQYLIPICLQDNVHFKEYTE